MKKTVDFAEKKEIPPFKTHHASSSSNIHAADIQVDVVSVIRTQCKRSQHGTNGSDCILPLRDLLNRRSFACLSQQVSDTLQQLPQRIRCDAVLLRLCTERIDERSKCRNIYDYDFLAKVRSRNEG